ncbi:MarC family protein [Actinoplanes sp. NPDC048796]|uniref:MarC family protein n=1 Tax=Actinoplanes sp. NPDC048796 TaxID=3155640 RepID=UPI00340E34F1
MSFKYDALVLFLALFALYSPVAALSSYLPIVRPFSHAEQLRLALGLVVNVAVFVLLAIWVGEPLLELLGISTAALTATGGIALILAAVPLMTGKATPPPPAAAPSSIAATSAAPTSAVPASASPTSAVPASASPTSASPTSASPTSASPTSASPTSAASTSASAAPASASPISAVPVSAAPASALASQPDKSFKSVLFTPITFPLTVGGTTFAFGVAASADVGGVTGRLFLSVAALAYAIVTGLTLYAAGHVERRISGAAAGILDRIAGILLTAIAVVLLTNGFTELALSAIDRFQ